MKPPTRLVSTRLVLPLFLLLLPAGFLPALHLSSLKHDGPFFMEPGHLRGFKSYDTNGTLLETRLGGSLDSMTSLLEDESVEAKVLSFPKGHAWSSAVGFIQTKDGSKKVFVKDRYDYESQIQVASSLWGQEFSKAFQVRSVVTPCESIERPSLESLRLGTPGHKLWKLKEEKWKREFGSQWENRTEGKVYYHLDDKPKPPPSEFDYWVLEEAIIYYNNSCTSGPCDEIRGASQVDTSLRRKLRAAADRSLTGSLDLSAVLLLTEFSQAQLETDSDFEDYVEYGLLKSPNDALTREETRLLLEKLTGVNFEVASLFAIAFALPDANIENVAIQEVSDGPFNWGVRLVHFDVEFLPASAGVSLESLRIKVSDKVPPEFVGHKGNWGYYLPVLFSFPAIDQPIQSSTLEGLKKISVSRLQTIAVEQFSGSSDDDDDDFDGVDEIIKTRIESMQRFASANPNCTLKDLAFHTISAWKRDFPDYEEENWTAEWIGDTIDWADGE